MSETPHDAATEPPRPDDQSALARERLDITIRSMALVAHYVGGIDGAFDKEEHDEAANPLVLNANMHSLLYDGNPDDDASIRAAADALSEKALRGKLADAIEEVHDEDLSDEELMDRMEVLSAEAEELNGYLPLEVSGSTGEEYRRDIREYAERYDLDLDVEMDTDDVDALYTSFKEEIGDATAEPFCINLAYALVHYGTYIGYASGSLFSSSPYSSQEEEAVREVGITYGLPAFDLMSAKMQAEMGADAMEAFASTSFMEKLREAVGL